MAVRTMGVFERRRAACAGLNFASLVAVPQRKQMSALSAISVPQFRQCMTEQNPIQTYIPRQASRGAFPTTWAVLNGQWAVCNAHWMGVTLIALQRAQRNSALIVASGLGDGLFAVSPGVDVRGFCPRRSARSRPDVCVGRIGGASPGRIRPELSNVRLAAPRSVVRDSLLIRYHDARCCQTARLSHHDFPRQSCAAPLRAQGPSSSNLLLNPR